MHRLGGLGVGINWFAGGCASECEGVTVDKLADVGPALRSACAAQKQGKTTVLEMMVTQELGDPFRHDVLSVPVRYLDKYKAYSGKQTFSEMGGKAGITTIRRLLVVSRLLCVRQRRRVAC